MSLCNFYFVEYFSWIWSKTYFRGSKSRSMRKIYSIAVVAVWMATSAPWALLFSFKRKVFASLHPKSGRLLRSKINRLELVTRETVVWAARWASPFWMLPLLLLLTGIWGIGINFCILKAKIVNWLERTIETKKAITHNGKAN